MTNIYAFRKNTRFITNQNKSAFKLITSVLLALLLSINFISVVSGQADAKFSVDVNTGCSPLTVTFTNNSTGTDLYYSWSYGDGNSSANSNTTHSHVFNWGNVYTVTLIATELLNPNDPDTAYATITVTQTVPADFTSAIPSDVCANEWINFNWDLTFKNDLESVLWDFGDGRVTNEMNTYPMTHSYETNGSYTVTYITYNQGCNDTLITPINVSGPVAEYNITPDSACIDETVIYTVTSSTGVNQYRWHTGEGGTISEWIVGDNNPYEYQYSTTRSKLIELELEGVSKTCSLIDTVFIYPVIAGIKSDAACSNTPIFYSDASEGANLSYYWDFGDGTTSTEQSLFHTYSSEDEFVITHAIENPAGCTDTIIDTIYTHTPPELVLADTVWYICLGDSAQLGASGGDSIFWSPDFGLNNPNSYTPKASPRFTNPYNVLIKDTTTNCTTSEIITVFVQQDTDWDKINLSPTDTSIIIGDTVLIQVDTGAYTYQWSPDYQVLSCINCANFVVLPLETTTYYLEMSDTLSCFSHQFEVPITVREEYKIGVPEAFTPNGDGINDIIKVNGWGIKRIVEFRVYNRWGKEVFFSDNAGAGWDGNIDGKPGAIDTYAYVVKAEMWSGETIVENGTFTLIR